MVRQKMWVVYNNDNWYAMYQLKMFFFVMGLPKVTDLNMDQLKWSGTDKIANIGLELLILNLMLGRAF